MPKKELCKKGGGNPAKRVLLYYLQPDVKAFPIFHLQYSERGIFYCTMF
jgi:hypothetical protein